MKAVVTSAATEPMGFDPSSSPFSVASAAIAVAAS
jgi:hypothetical protein